MGASLSRARGGGNRASAPSRRLGQAVGVASEGDTSPCWRWCHSFARSSKRRRPSSFHGPGP